MPGEYGERFVTRALVEFLTGIHPRGVGIVSKVDVVTVFVTVALCVTVEVVVE